MPDRILTIEECEKKITEAGTFREKDLFRRLIEIIHEEDVMLMINDDGPEPHYYALEIGKSVLKPIITGTRNDVRLI